MDDKNDLTRGVIWRKLVLYFLPIAAGTIFQQLYNAVDTLVVGKFVGTGALAAVGGSSATFINLVLNFFVSLSGGACVIISQHFGAKKDELVEREIHTAFTFCLYAGVIVGALMVIFTPQILTLLKTTPDTLSDAILYTRIYSAGCIFMFLFNMCSGILRALGDSKRPFIYLAVSCFINIILDLFFVIVLDLGVSGVALATVASQAISAVLTIIDLCNAKASYALKFKKLGISFPLLLRMMKIGIPAGVQSAMYGISNTILQIGVNTLGTVVVASWAMCGKVDGIYWAISAAFGTAVTNFVGQNYGAGKPDRIRECVKTSSKLFTCITIGLSAAILLAANPILPLMTNDPEVIKTTWTLIMYFVPYYILWTFIEVFSGVLRGVGDAIKPTIIVALGVCLLRIIWVLTAFRMLPTLHMITLCYPISWGVTDVALLIYYFKGSKLIKSLKK